MTRIKLATYCVLISILLFALNATASPISYITGTYQQVTAAVNEGAGIPIGGIPHSASVNFETPHYHFAADPGPLYPNGTADSFLSVDLSPGSFHAYAETAASIANYNGGVRPGAISRGYANLYIDAFDLLHFSSETLPVGTDVMFELTTTLHSILDASWLPANCPSPENAAFAGLSVHGLPGPMNLFHSSCGPGSEFMTASMILHATVGGDFGLNTLFQIQADSIAAGEYYRMKGLTGGSEHAVVNARNTGSVYIKILTPGADFKSDSGARYAPQAVPEPATLTLLVSALGGIALLRKRRLLI